MKKRGVDLGIRPSKATWLGGSWKERFMPVSIHLQKPPVFSFKKNDPKKGYFRSQKSHCWGSFVSRLALSENNVPQESNCILPVIPARGGAEVALGVYKTFLIYRPCMRRAPAKPVCACILRKWCPVSHVTCEAPLRTSHFSLHSSHSTLHTPHFTLHLIWDLLTLSQLISSHLISSHMSSKLSWTTSQYYFENLHAPCASQAGAGVLCAKLLQCCCPRTWPARDPGAMHRQANTFLTLHIALFTPHTPHFTLALSLNSSHLSSSHLISCLPICQLSSSWLF